MNEAERARQAHQQGEEQRQVVLRECASKNEELAVCKRKLTNERQRIYKLKRKMSFGPLETKEEILVAILQRDFVFALVCS